MDKKTIYFICTGTLVVAKWLKVGERKYCKDWNVYSIGIENTWC